MRVLMLSLDKKILERDSAVQRRLVALAERAGEITVFVPAEQGAREQLSPHLAAYSVGGGKIVQFFKLYRRMREYLVNVRRHAQEKVLRHKDDILTNLRMSVCFGRRAPDCIITVQDTAYLALLAYLLARRFRVPLEVQVHGFEKFYGVRKWLAWFVLRRADRIRVVSQRLKTRLAVDFGAPENRIYILPVYTQKGETGEMGEKWEREGVGETGEKGEMGGGEKKGEMGKREEKGERGETGEKEETGRCGERGETGEMGRKRKGVPYLFTFLTVGRLVPVKNVALQIRAFARLAKEYPQVRLRIIGDGPLLGSLKLKVKSLKLEDTIQFLGQQNNTAPFYEETDTFLLTSDTEGWGLAVTEAAAYKLPIIMTDVGLANEVLHHNKECIVVPVGDEEQLYLAMKEFVERPELRARLGEAAFRAFKSLPSAEEQIRKQVEEWRGLR